MQVGLKLHNVLAETIELFIGECIGGYGSNENDDQNNKVDLNRVHFIHLG